MPFHSFFQWSNDRLHISWMVLTNSIIVNLTYIYRMESVQQTMNAFHATTFFCWELLIMIHSSTWSLPYSQPICHVQHCVWCWWLAKYSHLLINFLYQCDLSLIATKRDKLGCLPFVHISHMWTFDHVDA